jgi:CBS domain-containing protein/Flp pilus assembly pilin Flp
VPNHDDYNGKRPARSFAGQADGASSVEYAAVLALVAVIGITALSVLGRASRETFDRVAGEMAAGSLASAHPGDPALGSGEASADGLAATSGGSVLAGLGWLLCGAALGCAGVWWAFRRRQTGQETTAEDKPEETQARPVERFVAKRQRILRTLSNDTRRLFDSHICVRHAMTDRVATVLPNVPIEELREKTANERIRHLLVVGKDKELVGMISDRDLASRQGTRAGDIMTPRPISVTADTPLCQAVTVLLNRRISALPVVEDGRVCGIITSTDLMMTLQCCIRLLQTLADASASLAEIAAAEDADDELEPVASA